MFTMLIDLIIAMAGGLIVASLIGWGSWKILSGTGFPGLGPILAFVAMAIILKSSEFTQMVLLFSGMLALGGFATLFSSGRPNQILSNRNTSPGKAPKADREGRVSRSL